MPINEGGREIIARLRVSSTSGKVQEVIDPIALVLLLKGRLMRVPRYSAIVTLFASAALALSACSAGLTSSGITVSDPEETTAAPPSLTDKESEKTTQPEKTAEPEKKPDSAATQPTATAQAAPDGWMMVTATIAPISFAVPDNWVAVGADVSEDEARHNAQRASLDSPDAAENLMDLRPDADLIYASTDPGHVGDSVYILNTLLPSAIMKSETLLRKEFESEGITVSAIRKEQSALGEVVIMDTHAKGISMTVFLVPVKDGQAMAFYSLSLDENRTRETVQTLVPTLTK